MNKNIFKTDIFPKIMKRRLRGARIQAQVIEGMTDAMNGRDFTADKRRFRFHCLICAHLRLLKICFPFFSRIPRLFKNSFHPQRNLLEKSHDHSQKTGKILETTP
jgi:hypothetical protein